jgi:hypothetical protein
MKRTPNTSYKYSKAKRSFDINILTRLIGEKNAKRKKRKFHTKQGASKNVS